MLCCLPETLFIPNMAQEPAEERPPFWGSWRRIYLVVVVYLFSLIALFYAFTRAYRFPS